MQRYPYDVLIDFAKGSLKPTINDAICSYLILNYYGIPELRITDLALACTVSTPSIIRFCREIGYLNFSDFKQAVTKHIVSATGEFQEYSLMKSVDTKSQLDDWLQQIQAHAQIAMTPEVVTKIEVLAKDLYHYEYVYVVGMSLSGLAADYLRIQLLRARKSILTLSKLKLESRLSKAPEKTLAIVISQHGNFLEQEPESAPYLQENCQKTWLVTQKPPTKASEQVFDDILCCDTKQRDILLEYHVLLYAIQLVVNTYHTIRE